MTSNLYHGLIWAEELFGSEPRWSYEPDISAIERTLQLVYPSHAYQVSYLTEGAFNKIYRVKLNATVNWIQKVTEIPTPKIIACDTTRETEIGFEWILITEIQGKSIADHWRQLEISAKSKNQLEGIGNIYSSATTDKETAVTEQPMPSENNEGLKTEGTQMGQIVSLGFFCGSHGSQNVPRGPSSCTKNWIDACLALSRNDQQLLDNYPGLEDLDSDTEEEIEAAEEILKMIKDLESILHLVFPNDIEADEPSVIFRDDLSQHNILAILPPGLLTGNT